MARTATGTFEIELTPGPAELDSAVARFDFTKSYGGDVEATGAGLMLSGGDPETGTAGYVAIETVDGRLHERRGRFALVQLGTMNAGSQELHYLVVPGSGVGELAGISGALRLTIDEDGTHRYQLDYEL